MKKLISTLILAAATLSFSGCSKSDNTTTTPSNPYGGDNGQVTFWCSINTAALYPITINIGGKYVGTINTVLTSVPDCDASDHVVKFDAAPGTYNMYATSANGGTWAGTVTITQAACQTSELHN